MIALPVLSHQLCDDASCDEWVWRPQTLHYFSQRSGVLNWTGQGHRSNGGAQQHCTIFACRPRSMFCSLHILWLVPRYTYVMIVFCSNTQTARASFLSSQSLYSVQPSIHSGKYSSCHSSTTSAYFATFLNFPLISLPVSVHHIYIWKFKGMELMTVYQCQYCLMLESVYSIVPQVVMPLVLFLKEAASSCGDHYNNRY